MPKVTRFPTNSTTRPKNSLGPNAVPCQVSDRFLKLTSPSKSAPPGAAFVIVDVMTGGYEDRGRKICQLIVSRAELEEVLRKMPR